MVSALTSQAKGRGSILVAGSFFPTNIFYLPFQPLSAELSGNRHAHLITSESDSVTHRGNNRKVVLP